MSIASTFLNDPLTVFLTGLALVILFFWYFATDIERSKRNIGSVLLIGVSAICVFAMTPFEQKLKGGIDIAGGSSFLLKVQPRESEKTEATPGQASKPKELTAVNQAEVDQAKKIIEQRLSKGGTQEPQVSSQGSDKILVQMPGIEGDKVKEVRQTLEKVAKLEFREVHRQTNAIGSDGKTLAQRVADGTEFVPSYVVYQQKGKTEDQKAYTTPILISRRQALGGADIAHASPSLQRNGTVEITLNGAGTDKMIALTSPMLSQVDRIAIILDGEVISSPVVNQVPLGKNFVIEGLDEPGEAQNLADSLMNPLENPLVVLDERSVSPTLGAAVVKQGIWAGLLGLAITFVCVLLYYRTAGLIALIGLMVNGIILFGAMAMFGFTFSLPGIAGIILTIGMAVDANVLIYERLREELATGKSLKAAIDASYEKAFTAIFDSNFTSLITAGILFALGSGSIKGFAITLTIGLIASMFSAILVTRVLFRWCVDFKILKNLTFLNLIKATNFNFLGKSRIASVFSMVLVVMTFATFLIKQEKTLGIDFTGGTLIQYQLGKDIQITPKEVDQALSELKLAKAATPQSQSNPITGNLLTVRCDSRDTDLIINTLAQKIPALNSSNPTNNVGPPSKEVVSPLIGPSFLISSLIALGLGLLGILAYITFRFEFSFAIGGFVAILHDVIISVGVVALIGNQLSLIHVGAILTIAGYSINDTIVIFDRIRENLLARNDSVKNIMNEAINATLPRTLLTSATTIITVAILSFYGGSNLRDFSFIILVGLLIGTYSSIFVATPIVLWWSRRKGGDLRSDVLATKHAEEAILSAP